MTDASFETKFAVLQTLVSTQYEHMNDRLSSIEKSVAASDASASARAESSAGRLKELHDKMDAMILQSSVTIAKMQAEIGSLKERERDREQRNSNTNKLVWGAVITALGAVISSVLAWVTGTNGIPGR